MKRLKKYRNFYIYFLQFQSLASSSANTTEFESNFGSNSFEKLNSLLTPEYYNLFKSLSRVSDGAKTIIKIREDLLDIIEKSKNYDYFYIF